MYVSSEKLHEIFVSIFKGRVKLRFASFEATGKAQPWQAIRDDPGKPTVDLRYSAQRRS
jgi:hypothetical protein